MRLLELIPENAQTLQAFVGISRVKLFFFLDRRLPRRRRDAGRRVLCGGQATPIFSVIDSSSGNGLEGGKKVGEGVVTSAAPSPRPHPRGLPV